MIPRPSLVYTKRLLPGSGGIPQPGVYARAFVGRTNKTQWKGYDVDEVMCMEIIGSSADSGNSYMTRFAFLLDWFDFFKQVARWRDPLTGQFPKLPDGDQASEKGVKQIAVQPQADFNSLPV